MNERLVLVNRQQRPVADRGRSAVEYTLRCAGYIPHRNANSQFVGLTLKFPIEGVC